MALPKLMLSVLLAACLSPPFFPADFSGPTCDPAAQEEECRCSECFAWDASPGAASYRVERKAASSSSWYSVGNVAEPMWCVARDSSFPRQGVLYEYRVVAGNEHGEADPSPVVRYRGAPYACFDGGREVQCYVGDPLVTR